MPESIAIADAENLQRESLDRYCRNIGGTLAANLLLVLLATVLLWPRVAHDALLNWCLLVCMIQAGQSWHARRYLDSREAFLQALHVWKRRFLMWAVLCGASLGASLMWFGVAASDPAAIMLLFAIAGAATLAGVSKAQVQSLALAFATALLLPLSAWLSQQGNASLEFIGIPVVLYATMYALLVRQANATTTQRLTRQAQIGNQGELKRNDLDQQSREWEFCSLAEHIPDNIARWDTEGRYLYINPTHERLLGATLAEVIGQRGPESHTHVRAAIAQVVATGQASYAARQAVLVEGREELHDVSLVPEFDDSGRLVSVLGIGRDMTATYRLQETIAAREREIRSLAENSADNIARWDTEGRYLYINKKLEQTMGKSRDELLGAVIPDVLENLKLDIAQVVATGQSILSTRQPVWVGEREELHDVSLVPEFDDSGRIVSVLGIGRDMTATYRMQEAIAEREAFLQALLNAIAIPVFYKDREGRYLGINRAFEQYFGRNREELLGKSVFDTHPPELAKLYHAKDAEVFEGKHERQEYESQIRHANGSLRDVMFSKAAFTDQQGEIKGLIGAVMDITHRKQSERELLARFNQIVELNDRLSENARQLEEQAVELEASQEQLKETETWYRSILHSAPDGMMVVDDRGRIALANQELERMFGYERGELAGQPLEILLPAEMRNAHLGVPEDYLGDNAQLDIPGKDRNLHAYRKDGSEFVVDVTLSRLPANNYHPAAICAAVRDVTARWRSEREMEDTRNRLKSVLHTIPDLVWLKNVEGIYLSCNPAFEAFFGATEAEIVGKTDHDFVDKELADFFQQKDMEAIDGGKAMVNEEWITYAEDGRRALLETRKVPVFDAEGKVTGVLGVARDITERKRLEQEVAKREHEFRTLVENAADTLARYGRDMRRLYANPAFAQLVEGGIEALIGKTPSEAPGGAYAKLYEEKLAEVLAQGEETEFELRWHDKSGRELCSLVNLTPEFAQDGTVETVLAVGRDISELHAFRQKIHQMAFYDPLTSLPNRALFNERLRQMIADASWHHQLAGVMMLDMDRFKEVNDTMGHVVGDELLREAGTRLNACVRGYDMVARLGGDEFAVLLPEIRHGEDIGCIAEKMRIAFEHPFLLAGKEMFITCSIGIALYPQDSDQPDDLIRYADSAMYYAKRSGRNAFRFYSRDLTESANERVMLESELRRALERDELEVYYQPKVRLSDGLVIGSEALLRWKHPVRGMVPPDKFISIAEDSGLIIEIGEWVLRESCRAAVTTNKNGMPAHKVAINLSARQFQSGDLLAVVRQVLEETGCRAEWIELEITESLLLGEDGEVLEVLKAFRAQGITIAIDDFGTGYSALSYLARFPITTLKIDRSFVNRIDADNFHAELVKAILSIAHCLGQEVVAEGVETPEQAAFLNAHHCQVAQGYLFSKPVPMREFLALPASFNLA